jgi:hypothetical protein
MDPMGAASRILGLSFVAALALSLGSGCAHKTVIHTVPEGAEVYVDGEYAGVAPVVVERFAGTGGQMQVRAELQAFDEHETVLERTDWFLWPLLVAVTPFIAIPTLVVPVAGPFICGGWAILTSPTLISLYFLRRYPDEVTVTLSPHLGDNAEVLPTDDWMVPDEYAPNPLPEPHGPPTPVDESPVPQSSDPERPIEDDPNPSPLPPEDSFRY